MAASFSRDQQKCARPGPAGAGRWLGTPFGLAWRLQRGSLLGWTVAMVCGGVLMGVIAGQVGDLLKDPAMQDMLRKMTPGGGTAVLTEQTLTDLYLAVVFSTLALVVAAYGIAGTLRLRGEERGLRAEPVLATATSRWRFLGSHLVVALLGAAWLMIVLGFVTGVVRGLATGDLPGELPRLLGAALAPLPAVWLCIGITVLIYGLVPQWSGLSWAVLAAFVGIGELGGLLNLPRWLLDVSPFSHVPALPGGVLTWAPLLVLAAIAVVLLGGGSTGFRRRDIG